MTMTCANEKYFVSRQRNWPDGDCLVEIAAGGRDYANPGMLAPKFPGEGWDRQQLTEAPHDR
jgi:hypothetical protein